MSLINISNLTFAYDGSYDNIFTDVSFQIDTDWKLGFCGRNGRGKTTFMKLLMGDYEYRGAISASVRFEYFPFAVADPSQNTLDILLSIAPEALLWQIQKETSKLAVSEDALYRPFSTLSSGERTKTLLAGLFLRENSFLLIDEPTNHLDMDSREVLEQSLEDFAGTLLAVSHDRYFINRLATRVMVMEPDSVSFYLGNYDEYLEKKNRETQGVSAPNPRSKTAMVKEKRKDKKVLEAQRAAKMERETLERRIVDLEAEVSKLEGLLAKPEIYQTPEMMLSTVRQMKTAKEEIESLYDQWAALQEAEDAF